MLSAKLSTGGEVITIFDTDEAVEIIEYISEGGAESYVDLPAEDVRFNLRQDFDKYSEHGSSIYLNRTKLESGDDYLTALRYLVTLSIQQR